MKKKAIKKVKVTKSVETAYEGLSIARIVFKFLDNMPQDLRAESRKKQFAFIALVVKKYYPNSKFNLAHYGWYISRQNKYRELGLRTDRLQKSTAEIYDLLEAKKNNNKKEIKKNKVKKA